MKTLSLSIKEHIAYVEMTRGEALNTMVPEFWEEMVELFSDLAERTDIRVCIFSGSGRLFSAGLDLKTAMFAFEGQDRDGGRVRERLYRKIKRMQESFSVIERCPFPVIAVVHNACIGAGVDLVTACDMRIGTADCYFTIQEVNVGIVADVGTLQRIGSLLPHGLVRELAFTGRKFKADEALRYGFVNACAPDRDAAMVKAEALAQEIATKSPLVIRGVKNVINYARDHSVSDSLNQVALWNSGMLLSEDVGKAIKATMDKTGDQTSGKSEADFDDLYK